MPRQLITGGAGFIGSHLAEALLAQGQHVVAIDDLSTGRVENIAHLIEQPHFQFVNETIRNDSVMDRLVSDCDVIYHLAAAVGTSVVALFGPTSPERTGPYGSGHTVIRKGLACSPCFRKACDTLECMKTLSFDEVFLAVRERLGPL